MTRWLHYLFNFWPFATKKITSIKSNLPKQFQNFCPTIKEMPKTFKMLPRRRNFAKSGHTDDASVCVCALVSAEMKMLSESKQQQKLEEEYNII